MKEGFEGDSRAGHGIPFGWEEAMRAGEPMGDPWIDGLANWTRDEKAKLYEGAPTPEPPTIEDSGITS